MRRVLLGAVDVYGWEDAEGEVAVDVDKISGILAWQNGHPFVLVSQALEGADLAALLEEHLPD